MLSGAFYLSNDVPEKYDYVNIHRFMKENEHVVFFHNKQDLIKKVEYYLHHEEERMEMIDAGKKRALETMTYDQLMERMMVFINSKIQAK